jgi:hypothetical protein
VTISIAFQVETVNGGYVYCGAFTSAVSTTAILNAIQAANNYIVYFTGDKTVRLILSGLKPLTDYYVLSILYGSTLFQIQQTLWKRV